MRDVLLACPGGSLALPPKTLVLVDRKDGGNLVVHPPRDVWERSELNATELSAWAALVAAAGRAMIDTLPQLDGGCINYWEAGNWALNVAADPPGPKTAKTHRRVHMHLLGRSPHAASAAWRWGEAPAFPDFANRFRWAATFERLTPAECWAIVERTRHLLVSRYAMPERDVMAGGRCDACGYPTAPGASSLCGECAHPG